MPTRPSARPSKKVVSTLAAVAALAFLSGCSDDDGSGADVGFDSAEAVVDAHIQAARVYDLEADCNLRTPERREEMAAFDGVEADGYCLAATASIVEMADEATRARSRAIYTDPAVTSLDRPGGTWFRITSPDQSYVEEVEAIEVDGRWWIGTIESDVHDHGHDEGDDHDDGSEHVEGDEHTDHAADGETDQ